MSDYAFTTLDDPLATGGTYAQGLNDFGEIVGYYIDAAGSHGFVYSAGTYSGFTLASRNSGQFSQSVSALDGVTKSGVFLGSGTYIQLSGPIIPSSPGAINQPTPAVEVVLDEVDGFTATVSGTSSWGAILAPGPNAQAHPYGINGVGQVVGDYESNSNPHGFIYSGTTFTSFDDPLGHSGTTTFGTWARGINDSGQVVGYYLDSSGKTHGFEYDTASGSVFFTLDDPLAVGRTFATGINNLGQIVGYYIDSTGIHHGFLYTGGNYTTIDEPNAAGGTTLNGINNSGEIVGAYIDGGGDTHGFSAQATSSPSPTPANFFGAPTLALAQFGSIAGGWSSQNSFLRAVADVNGDGKADIVGFSSNGVVVSLNDGSGNFAAPQLVLSQFGSIAGGWTSQDQFTRTLADVNGDGKADIVGFSSNGVVVSLNDGTGHFAAPQLVLSQFGSIAGGWTSQDQFTRVVADVNGDGKADIVGFSSNGVVVSLNDGTGQFAAPQLVLSQFGSIAGGWTSQDQFTRVVADVNGDGKADIVGFSSNGVVVALNDGTGHFTAPQLVLSQFGSIAGGWTSQDQFTRTLADVNGDGKSDIVGFSSNGVVVALNDGTGHFAAPQLVLDQFGSVAGGWTSQDLYPRMLADLSGTGVSDIVGFSSNGVIEAHNTLFM